MVEVMAAD